MSFLDNLKKRAAERKAAETGNTVDNESNAVEEKKVNPLAALKANKSESTGENKGSSLIERMKAKRAAQQSADENNADTAVEDKPETPAISEDSELQKKINAVVKEKLEENTEDNETSETADPVTEITDSIEETPVIETPLHKETDNVTKESNDAEDITEETKEEAPKKRRRRHRKNVEAAEDSTNNENENETKTDMFQDIKVHEYVANYDILGKKVSFEDMAGMVMDYFINDEWKQMQDSLNEKMNKIRIEPDMNPGTIKYVLAELNNLNDEIAGIYVEQKQLLDILTDKEFGAATALMVMNQKGANDMERKANGFKALTDATFGDNEHVNLINLISAVRARYAFLNSLINRIKYKSNVCITMSGAMKLEQNLIV